MRVIELLGIFMGSMMAACVTIGFSLATHASNGETALIGIGLGWCFSALGFLVAKG